MEIYWRFTDGTALSFYIPDGTGEIGLLHSRRPIQLRVRVVEVPPTGIPVTYDTPKKEGKMNAQIGDLILTDDEQLSVVKSVEAGLKGKVVYHTTNGDFTPKEVLSIYRPVYTDNTPEKEPDSNDKLADALQKLTEKLSK